MAEANQLGLRAASISGMMAARNFHQSTTPKRELASPRQAAQEGSNQLSLETPRNTVGMW